MNTIHTEALSAIQKCEEINIRYNAEVKRYNAIWKAAIGFTVMLVLAVGFVGSMMMADQHYAMMDKINQERLN